MNITIGCDPEVFAKKDGEIVSAYGLIEGNKHQPLEVENGMVQVDGMALEFGITPASKEEDFLYNIKDVMSQLQSMIPDYELEIVPTAEFDIHSQPREAIELGCSHDYNAWTGERNESPSEDLTMRTAGGHIHIGWCNQQPFKDDAVLVAKYMDYYQGLPSLLYDSDTKRREMYGKAGAYRVKPYGIEYRTLSNFWLKDEGLMSLVFNNAMKAMKRLFSGNFIHIDDEVEEVINTSNIDKAVEIMDREGIPYAI